MADPRYPPVSPEAAVARATWFVNGPVFLLMFGTPALVFGLAVLAGAPMPTATIVAMFSAAVGWCGAWAAWSWLVVRWRLWAYRRVADLRELKRLGVEAKIIWPEGHPFQRTEIISASTRRELAELEALARASRPTSEETV